MPAELYDIDDSNKNGLLILVPTAIAHLDRRNQVRQTWMHECNSLPFCACIFLTGLSKHEAENEIISTEAEKYKDIIQTAIIDHYNNLTLKTMFSIK